MNKLKSYLPSAELTVVLSVISTLLAVISLIMFQVRKTDKEVITRETQCYKELTMIVQGSSGPTADWIEKTVQTERSYIRGPNYCRALELVTEAGLAMLKSNDNESGDQKDEDTNEDKQ